MTTRPSMTFVMVSAFWLIWPLREPAMMLIPTTSRMIGMMLRTAHATMPSELILGPVAITTWATRSDIAHLPSVVAPREDSNHSRLLLGGALTVALLSTLAASNPGW